jgi:hypothetical protein
MKKLTKKQVDTMFIEELMPLIRVKEQEYRSGRFTKDIPMRCEEYNNFVDSLMKDGQLTNSQAGAYCIPAYLVA